MLEIQPWLHIFIVMKRSLIRKIEYYKLTGDCSSLQRIDIKYNKYGEHIRKLLYVRNRFEACYNYSIYACFYVYQQQQYDNTALLRLKNEIKLNHILVLQIFLVTYSGPT